MKMNKKNIALIKTKMSTENPVENKQNHVINFFTNGNNWILG